MAGPLRRYAFINAKLRARISRLLPESTLERLVRATDLTTALHVLADGPYGTLAGIYERTGDLRMVEMELFRREVALTSEIERHVDGSVQTMVRALATRFEVEVLKNVLRVWFDQTVRGRPADAPYLYRDPIYHELPIDQILAATDVSQIAVSLSKTPYSDPVAEGGDGVARGTLFPMEIALDRWFYQSLLDAAAALPPRDREIADRMIGVEIDLQNIAWIVRLKSLYDFPLDQALGYLIPHGQGITSDAVASAYGKGRVTDLVAGLVDRRYPQLKMILSGSATDETSRLLLIERVLAQITLLEVRRIMGGYPFTIGVVLAYFVLERSEVQSLVTILNAKFYGMSEDQIRGEL